MAAGGTGDLALLNGANTTFGTLIVNDFSFSIPAGGTTVWSTPLLGGVSFTLESLSVVQTGTTLTLDGSGFLSGGNYEQTAATFALSLNKLSGQIEGSMSTSVAAVPIPGAALLFGSALFGLAAVARRKAGRTSEDDQTT
jgi:hypothetical protein